MNIRIVISTICIIIFFISIVNIILSTLVYYFASDYLEDWAVIAWPISAVIIAALLYTDILNVNNLPL